MFAAHVLHTCSELGTIHKSILHLGTKFMYHFVISYVKFVIACHIRARKKHQARFRISGSGAKQCTVLNAFMRHTNTSCRESRFKAYIKCIGTPSARRKIGGDLSKAWQRNINTV